MTKIWKERIENYLPKVTSKAECSEGFAALVIRGYYSQIKKLDQPAGQIFMELRDTVKLYGGRKEIDPEVLKECSRLIIDKFPHISVPEIREAYRQWSAGEIEVKGAEMYGGEFNAAQVGKIIGAYCEKRRGVLSAYLREREEEKDREAQAEKRRIMQEAFDAEFPRMIERARNEITDWREVPAYWYESANKRGMIKFEPGEAVKIFTDAQELERIERANEQEESVTLSDIFRQQEKDPVERAKVIARKLTVFRKLIK